MNTFSSPQDKQHTWVREWWRALQPRQENSEPLPHSLMGLGRADRAKLRRCDGMDELLAQHAALLFADYLCKLKPKEGLAARIDYERWVWVAGILAHVKADSADEKSLAWHLGRTADGDKSGAPVMSERRFKAMTRCVDMPDLFTHWRRAVQLNHGRADVACLADDLFAWQKDLERKHDGYRTHTSESIRFRWSYDYYMDEKIF